MIEEDPKVKLQSAINKAYGVGKVEEGEQELTAGEQIEKVLKKQRIFMEAEADRMVQECVKRRVLGFKHNK